MKREQRLVDLKIEQSGKPTSEKMTSHGSVSDLPADIVSVDRVLIRLTISIVFSWAGIYFVLSMGLIIQLS